MQYRTMPAGGDRLSVLGFGAMRLPLKEKAIDEERGDVPFSEYVVEALSARLSGK